MKEQIETLTTELQEAREQNASWEESIVNINEMLDGGDGDDDDEGQEDDDE